MSRFVLGKDLPPLTAFDVARRFAQTRADALKVDLGPCERARELLTTAEEQARITAMKALIEPSFDARFDLDRALFRWWNLAAGVRFFAKLATARDRR